MALCEMRRVASTATRPADRGRVIGGALAHEMDPRGRGAIIGAPKSAANPGDIR